MMQTHNTHIHKLSKIIKIFGIAIAASVCNSTPTNKNVQRKKWKSDFPQKNTHIHTKKTPREAEKYCFQKR